jgi:hypothetical protein
VRGRPAAALLLGAGLLAGCAHAPEPAPAQPRFATQQVAWAHLRTLHYGDREFTLPRPIRGLAVSDYGFFLELSDGGSLEGPATWGFFDGEAWLPVGGDPVGPVHVSPDGRYAGWVVADGPRRPAGRVREVVVADIRRGEAAFKDHSGMGGGVGDDLTDRYEELAPAFLGFDEASAWAYWTDASGGGELKRGSVETGEVEDAGTPPNGDPFDEPVSTVVDTYRGRRAGPSPESGPVDLQYGLYSPDERFAVDVSAPSRTLVYDASTGRRLRVRFPDRAQYFGGWLPGDRFYVVGSAERVDSYSLSGPDPSRGRIVVCRLPAGTCRAVARVPGLRDVVVPGTQALLG